MNQRPVVAILASTIVLMCVGNVGRPDRPIARARIAHQSTSPRDTAQAGIYDGDPHHLWNRVHDALFLRVGNNGQEYGRDRVEPLLWRGSRHLLGGDSHNRLIAVLEEFNKGGETLVRDPIKRALLQRDLWLVFSWLESSHDEFYGFGGKPDEWRARQERLRKPLAQAIGRLALSPAQVSALPDTYAAAVASGEFAAQYDSNRPDRPYLPADLYAPEGSWVSLGRKDDLIARSHVLNDNPFTNSAFLVFINLPDGRAATRAYVERLSAFTGPLFVSTRSSPTPAFPNFNPAIPQFPAGTKVALVRRALLVTSTKELMATTLTENVQVRVYRRVPAWDPDLLTRATLTADDIRSWQSVSEFTFGRKRLLSGVSGGLRAVGGEGDFLTGFSTHGVDPFEEISGEAPEVTAARPSGALRPSAFQEPQRSDLMSRCISCHHQPGVYSFNTFAMNFSNVAPSVMPIDEVLASAVTWKQSRMDWVLLKRLMGQ